MYVGDDERDVQASQAAGMLPVVALYGYLGENAAPHNWEAHAAIEHPLDLLSALSASSRGPAGRRACRPVAACYIGCGRRAAQASVRATAPTTHNRRP